MPVEKSYSISELAEAADVTIRTIRYYVGEALLPPPESGGRAAAYSQGHLARLELIKILKDEFLPLHEIRALLSGLDDQAVAELLAEKQVQQSPPLPAPDSAKAYLQTLLLPPAPAEQGHTLLRNKLKAQQIREDTSSAAATRAARSGSWPGPAAEEAKVSLSLGQATPAVSPASPAEAERWQRYPITPEVELHIKESAQNPNLWQKVEQLIKIARQILSSIILS